MNQAEVNHFNKFYDCHQRAFQLQEKAMKTIDASARGIRRTRDYFDHCPDKLKPEQLENYFADLVESHSWSTVKIDRLRLQHFWKCAEERVELGGHCQTSQGPNHTGYPHPGGGGEADRCNSKTALSGISADNLFHGTCLGETLSLQVGDIDASRKLVHSAEVKATKTDWCRCRISR